MVPGFHRLPEDGMNDRSPVCDRGWYGPRDRSLRMGGPPGPGLPGKRFIGPAVLELGLVPQGRKLLHLPNQDVLRNLAR
jgi:hypothetical protein